MGKPAIVTGDPGVVMPAMTGLLLGFALLMAISTIAAARAVVSTAARLLLEQAAADAFAATNIGDAAAGRP